MSHTAACLESSHHIWNRAGLLPDWSSRPLFLQKVKVNRPLSLLNSRDLLKTLIRTPCSQQRVRVLYVFQNYADGKELTDICVFPFKILLFPNNINFTFTHEEYVFLDVLVNNSCCFCIHYDSRKHFQTDKSNYHEHIVLPLENKRYSHRNKHWSSGETEMSPKDSLQFLTLNTKGKPTENPRTACQPSC